jgi:hypothetical protein
MQWVYLLKRKLWTWTNIVTHIQSVLRAFQDWYKWRQLVLIFITWLVWLRRWRKLGSSIREQWIGWWGHIEKDPKWVVGWNRICNGEYQHQVTWDIPINRVLLRDSKCDALLDEQWKPNLRMA